jgi:hypothetical protein
VFVHCLMYSASVVPGSLRAFAFAGGVDVALARNGRPAHGGTA